MGALGLQDRGPRLACDYETYFRTGLYDSRYPAPNPRTLRTVLGLLDGTRSRILDFGCGSGRYAGLLLERSAATVVAYDTSVTALAMLQRRLGAHVRSGRLVPLRGGIEELVRWVGRHGPLDVALLLFGVLGHVAGRAERVRLLRHVVGLLAPRGVLMLSVPNRRRRFRAEQARCRERVARGVLEEGDVVYVRKAADGSEIGMFYHLYTPDELRQDLKAAGLTLCWLEAESVLPERHVVASRPLAMLDGILRRVTPISLSYGFLALARPLAAGSP